MLSLKGIQAFQSPNNHVPFHKRAIFRRKSPSLSLCRANDSNSTPPPEGDLKKQELLARIAMLQTQKLQLTDYLDERSAYLTQFAEEASLELDQVGENALKELDEASTRIMGKIESQMQAFEETAELNKQEIEESEKMLAEFESQMVKGRNEGMFFKNLREKTPPVDNQKEMEKIKDINKEIAGSKARRNIYFALMVVVVIGISDALVTSSSNWWKIPILGAILVGLLFQIFYEQRVLSEKEKTDEGKSQVEE